MPPSSTVNVVRYSALVAGIFYGIIHRRTLQARHDEKVRKGEIEKRAKWVEEARKEWAAMQNPPTSSSNSGTDEYGLGDLGLGDLLSQTS